MRLALLCTVLTLGAGDLHAQMRGAAFEQWFPPRIAAELASADSTLVRVGSHAGKGALIGAAIGGGVGILLGLIVGGGSCADCDSQPSRAGAAAIVGLVGAGAGAVVGVLAGLSSPKYEWRSND